MCANAWGFCPARATLWAVMEVGAAGQIRVRASGALWGAQITDPEHERIIYIAAGGLLVLAVALAVGTIWWWRNSRVDHPALGPLEVMGTRSWWKGDWTSRRRRLDEVRPTVPEPESGVGEPVNLSAVATDDAVPFDDLADPADPADAPSDAPNDALNDAAVESVSLEALVAALGVEPPDALADDITSAAPAPMSSSVSPRPSVVIDTSSPGREAEDAAAPAATEPRAPIDPLLRQQRSE